MQGARRPLCAAGIARKIIREIERGDFLGGIRIIHEAKRLCVLLNLTSYIRRRLGGGGGGHARLLLQYD